MDWHSSITGFKAYLQLERSLAANSVEAYFRDVKKLVAFLQITGSESKPNNLTKKEIRSFLQYLNELGIGARSQARVLSSLRAFYKYLLVEDLVETDPTELIESPRLARKLPKVLTFEEIQKMLEAIDLSHPTGHP